MKYSINEQGLYDIPTSVSVQRLDNHEIAEAISDIWFWDNYDSRGVPPNEYKVKLYTDEGGLIEVLNVGIDYSPLFNAYQLEN